MLTATAIIAGMLLRTNSKYKALVENAKICLPAKKTFVAENRTSK
jgi:hypothetical protein